MAAAIKTVAHVRDPAKIKLEALVSEQSIAAVLKDERLTSETMPEDWFMASEVHLSKSPQADLVVMGNHIARGPYTAAFWVLHKSQSGYRVVLYNDAHDLTLKNTGTNGLCNLETAVVTLRYTSTAEWGFDGTTYKIVKTTLQPNGYEDSIKPAKYRIRGTFAQLPDQGRESVLVKARSWIWRQWRGQATAMAKVSVRDENGGTEDCSYLIDKNSEDGEMQITLKIRRVVWERNSPNEPHRRVVEEQTVVASQVRRTEPSADNVDSAKAFSDNEELPPSEYRLHFTDGHFDLHSL